MLTSPQDDLLIVTCQSASLHNIAWHVIPFVSMQILRVMDLHSLRPKFELMDNQTPMRYLNREISKRNALLQVSICSIRSFLISHSCLFFPLLFKEFVELEDWRPCLVSKTISLCNHNNASLSIADQELFPCPKGYSQVCYDPKDCKTVDKMT